MAIVAPKPVRAGKTTPYFLTTNFQYKAAMPTIEALISKSKKLTPIALNEINSFVLASAKGAIIIQKAPLVIKGIVYTSIATIGMSMQSKNDNGSFLFFILFNYLVRLFGLIVQVNEIL